MVDLISGSTRSALAKELASSSLEEAELELIEAIDMFRAHVDTAESYQRESVIRSALSKVRDAATKSILEQALSNTTR